MFGNNVDYVLTELQFTSSFEWAYPNPRGHGGRQSANARPSWASRWQPWGIPLQDLREVSHHLVLYRGGKHLSSHSVPPRYPLPTHRVTLEKDDWLEPLNMFALLPSTAGGQVIPLFCVLTCSAPCMFKIPQCSTYLYTYPWLWSNWPISIISF